MTQTCHSECVIVRSTWIDKTCKVIKTGAGWGVGGGGGCLWENDWEVMYIGNINKM